MKFLSDDDFHRRMNVVLMPCNFFHWMVYYPQCPLACYISAHPLLTSPIIHLKKLAATTDTSDTSDTTDTTDTLATKKLSESQSYCKFRKTLSGGCKFNYSGVAKW